ncbi:phosphoenolpyruvate carboxylase kinase 1-like [Dendrobium catenatum]|uniref:phosphoenolpyruvate carboxylase kinase 1-like n=1 Tax=Dendrobium catenatum TaxID=906689 RepID=UPI0010A07BC1|nr:phosphoenolpyruvate carboxylase kinase 1-like [Dendrobium catenatum]
MGESFDLDYCLGELLGRGQFGTVYQCVSVSTGKGFAVKIIDKFSDCFNRRLVYSEIKFTLLAASENQHSVQIHQVYEDFTAVYLILDLCPGLDLFDRIASHGAFFEKKAAALITELVQAIAECHRRGIAHRDIKLENILFGSNGRLLLADFSCAAHFEKRTRTLKGKVGTPAYAAPEVMAGETYDEKVDVWSAGVVLYLLGWTLSFNGETVEEIVAAVKKGDPVCFPKEFFPWLSRGAEDLIEQMLARDPVMRLSAEQGIHGSRKCQ